ncbi:MAG: T9SS type A sorting domain-containing protein [Bacteroidia bacterium]|jgi:hypothetical protein|nr:T9SS type A sorting domain-containing protein [Bacteroidia bacterium]
MNKRQTFILLFLFLGIAASAQLLSFDKSTVLNNPASLRGSVYCANGDLVSVFSGTLNTPENFTVIRYDEDGNIVWKTEYSNPSVFSCHANEVIEALNGDLIIAFSAVKLNFTTPASGLLRISSQGSILWQKLYTSGSMLSDVLTVNSKLAEASDGSIYLALADVNVSYNPLTESVILLRFSASGTMLWGISFGPAPPMLVVKLMKAPAAGVHIGAVSYLNGNAHFITVDSSGIVTRSIKYSQAGTLTDFVTDANDNLKAILTTDNQTWTRLIGTDSLGMVTTTNEASHATGVWGNKLMWSGSGFISSHFVTGGGTMLCSWSASPSLTNGISFLNSSQFSAQDIFMGNDGGIYMTGISGADTFTSNTRLIKTKPMQGNNFPFDGCSQTSTDFTIVSVTVSNPVTQALAPSAYTPVTETSSFQLQTVSASVTDNCTVVSINETAADAFEMYPNPAADMITITGNFSADAVFEIFSLTGQTVMNASVVPGGNSLKLSTVHLPEGVYLLRVSEPGKNGHTQRFVISR